MSLINEEEAEFLGIQLPFNFLTYCPCEEKIKIFNIILSNDETKSANEKMEMIELHLKNDRDKQAFSRWKNQMPFDDSWISGIECQTGEKFRKIWKEKGIEKAMQWSQRNSPNIYSKMETITRNIQNNPEHFVLEAAKNEILEHQKKFLDQTNSNNEQRASSIRPQEACNINKLAESDFNKSAEISSSEKCDNEKDRNVALAISNVNNIVNQIENSPEAGMQQIIDNKEVQRHSKCDGLIQNVENSIPMQGEELCSLSSQKIQYPSSTQDNLSKGNEEATEQEKTSLASTSEHSYLSKQHDELSGMKKEEDNRRREVKSTLQQVNSNSLCNKKEEEHTDCSIRSSSTSGYEADQSFTSSNSNVTKSITSDSTSHADSIETDYSVVPGMTLTELESPSMTSTTEEKSLAGEMVSILDSSKEGVTLTYTPHTGILTEKETRPDEQSTPASFSVRDQEKRLQFETLRSGQGKGSQESQTEANNEESTKGTNNINILLLGETGVGKSTFINSLLNNIHYSTFKAVTEGKLKIIIDTAFTISDEHQEILRVNAKVNYGNNLGGKNESFAVNGESSTQRPVVHRIFWEDEEGHSKNINIIDTPGVNDTRGMEQDKRNFKEIFKEIDSLGELHAICILLKPNEARFTSAFRYCFDELLTRLHKSATDNILFCFTNTRSTLYRPGDTLSTLRMYLTQLERGNNILIRADRNNIFCFDNDCFRYALAVENNVYDRTSHMDALFAEGWDHNVKETKKFLNRAQSLPTHNIQDTVSLNVNIRLLAQLARPLAEIARIHLVNMKLTDDHIAELRKYNPKDMRAAPLQRQIVVLKFNKLKKPRTICKSSKCTTWKTINTYDFVPIYKTCHEECYLKDFPEGDNTALYSCNIFRHQYGGHYQGGFLEHCRKCGCHFTQHEHTFYEQRTTNQTVEDKRALMEHQDAKLKAKEVKKEIEELEDSKRAMELEHDLIRDFCAEAAVFLHYNSMKSTADPYKIVLDEIIADEKNKAAISGNNDMLYEIETLQVMYTDRFEQISSEIAKHRRGPLTSDEIQKRIINLSLQKICGNEVENLMTICKEIINDTSNNNFINK